MAAIFPPQYSRHRVAIYLRQYFGLNLFGSDRLICSKANRMLQNTVQCCRHQQGCWQLHYDESHFIEHFISCHSQPLTNKYIWSASVVHGFIITHHYSREGNCHRLTVEPSLSITRARHATLCTNSRQWTNHTRQKTVATLSSLMGWNFKAWSNTTGSDTTKKIFHRLPNTKYCFASAIVKRSHVRDACKVSPQSSWFLPCVKLPINFCSINVIDILLKYEEKFN